MNQPLRPNTQTLGKRYTQFCKQIHPGDVFAFSGCDIPSSVVKMATQSCYVHVAIVLSVTETPKHPDPILIAESHIDTSLPSEGSGKVQLGVQFQRLSNRLVACQGPVWWAGLKTPLHNYQLQKMSDWLHTIEMKGVPYDFPQAIGAGVDTLDKAGFTNQPNFDALFCSELVTRALQLAQVIDPKLNPSEQTPADVMAFPCLKQPILISPDE